jgi:hypothetical protein
MQLSSLAAVRELSLDAKGSSGKKGLRASSAVTIKGSLAIV